MTIAGDVAQTSAPGGAHAWPRMLNPVLKGSWRLAELTVNYRTPTAVADAAQRAAVAAGLPVSRLTSARDLPGALTVRRVDDLEAAVLEEVAAALDRITPGRGGADDAAAGRVAVIAAPDRVAGLHRLLEESPLRAALRPAGTGSMLDAHLAVMSPRTSKGLEFDVVVLVEPAELAEVSAGDLYVAMTRPTQALRVIGVQAPPRGLV
jgi:hypothetical protein